ncbi:acyl-CoA dehydrogenase [Halobellus captivus]|uniref:acyl-CoA dehydrogenase n=1 Tax=Halobellus captivus TaxID=2592614 RepID=UPI0011A58A16|nr:acyl-CoA dehydrogenase [Halobellus captivus]
MSNFKSGSGNLNFGEDDGDKQDDPSQSANSHTPTGSDSVTKSPDAPESETSAPVTQDSSEQSDNQEDPATETYPYFVRRSNVGDERDTRLEIHVRDEVATQEAQFRTALAEHLDTDEVSKTDAREFALLAAFENPESVAELMRDEGFGMFD